MTAVLPSNADFSTSRFTLATSHPQRMVSEGDLGAFRPGSARAGQKRSLTPRATSGGGVERTLRSDGAFDTPPGTSSGQPPTWLRRLSKNMSTSRDSSRTAASRPGSAAKSLSNASFAFSHVGSTAPIFQETTPPSLPPNKLVKRASSLRSFSGSPSPVSASRLPLPVFRRPATSHQRSATYQEGLASSASSTRRSVNGSSPGARYAEWRQYFTPRVAAGDRSTTRRRNSTGIPNPIKRVYPDRRYTPVLVSASELVRPALVELDDSWSEHEGSTEAAQVYMPSGVASSSLSMQSAEFGASAIPRRSFSIGDLLSTGPQPLWKRPSSTRSKHPSSKLARRERPRVASAPLALMGSSLSNTASQEVERPAKRRDLTDPQSSQRSIDSAADGPPSADTFSHQDPDNATPSPSEAERTIINAQTPPSHERQRLPATGFSFSQHPPARDSLAPSEVPSTVGSDSEHRSLGDNSTDYQSDAVWDSYPTRTTRSSIGRRGPHVESIFDDSPPPTFSSERSTRLRDILNEENNLEHNARYRHSTIEEEESVISTPVRSIRTKSVASTPSARPRASQISSSPPARDAMPDLDDLDWDASDDEEGANGSGLGIQQPASRLSSNQQERSLPFRFGPVLRFGASNTANSTPQRTHRSAMEKANLFDWSEQQPSPSHATNSPPRPRTVHGKKDQDSRGSRSVGRRAPSAMHARSHSVPAVPEVDGKRSNVIANKFGTWNVGSKAVTEDWNEDFDFDGPDAPAAQSMEIDEKRIDSGHEMFVPKSIREQQQNVVANIELLREWGLLIEELKELRVRASALDMMNGRFAKAWREVDAMIELADQESAEHTLEPRRSPPSSPGFDYGDFEEPGFSATTPSQSSSAVRHELSPTRTDDALGKTLASPQQTASLLSRPRKDSELVAQTVIAALQSKRSASDPTTLQSETNGQKVPFDTATLRHIVPYVNGLKRKVKEALRETEGLYSSPQRRTGPEASRRADDSDDDDDEPAFRSIFNDIDDNNTPNARHSRRREQAATDNDGFESPFPEKSGPLAKRLQRMHLPP